MLLHTLKLDIRSNSIDLGNAVHGLYASNDLEEHFPDNARRVSLIIDALGAVDPIEPVSPGDGEFSELNLIGGMCWFREGRFYSDCEGEFKAVTSFEPESGSLRVQVGGTYSSLSPTACLSIVLKQLTQSFVLPFYRLKFLHGAVVAGDGAAVMLRGKGGAGKTTAALQLLEAGWSLLSDDGPLFTHTGSESFALSSLDCSQATATTVAILPFLERAVTGEPDHRGKYRIDTRTLQRDDSWRKPHRVRHIVNLTRARCEKPTLARVDRSIATAQLMAEAATVFRAPVFAANPIYREHSAFCFDIVTDLVKNANVFELTYADEHLALIPGILERLDG